MDDTVIAPDLRERWETLLLDAVDNDGEFTDEDAAWSVKMIERVSKAEQENVALKAENERLTKIIEDSRMDLKGFDEETLAWFAAGGQKGK